jgi:hypothetical protein
MPPRRDAGKAATVAGRWVPKTMLVLSFVGFAASAGIWLSIWYLASQVTHLGLQPHGGLDALPLTFMGLMMLFCIGGASSAGCVFALIGLGYLAIACRRFGRLLAVCLVLNAAAGPLPLLASAIWEHFAVRPR